MYRVCKPTTVICICFPAPLFCLLDDFVFPLLNYLHIQIPPTSGVTGRGVGQGAECPPHPTPPQPRDFWPGNFCWPTGTKESRKKWKRGENGKEKKGKLKMELWKSSKICFSLLKTTKICFGSTKMEIFCREKNQRKWFCPPQKKFCCYAPASDRLHGSHIIHYTVLLWLLQVAVPLRVLWGYSAATACAVASQPFVTVVSEYPWSTLNSIVTWVAIAVLRNMRPT